MIASVSESGTTTHSLTPPPRFHRHSQAQHRASGVLVPRTLADIKTFPVATVPADYQVHWALTMMRGQRISAIVAVEDDRPVGIFTERDAVRFAASNRDAERVPVNEAMGAPPITAPEDMELRTAHRLVATKGVRHLIVTDQDGRLSGIVTEADFLTHLASPELLATKQVGEVMCRGVATLPEQALAREALPLMVDQGFSCVVVEHHGRPVGILTGRDLVRLGDERVDLGITHLGQVMSYPLHTVADTESLANAISLMRQINTRRLVVVGEAGNTLGIISRHNIMKILGD